MCVFSDLSLCTERMKENWDENVSSLPGAAQGVLLSTAKDIEGFVPMAIRGLARLALFNYFLVYLFICFFMYMFICIRLFYLFMYLFYSIYLL